MSNLDDEILAMYTGNVGEGHIESEPEDDDQMPAAPPPPRGRSNKRKQAPADDYDDGYGSDLYYDEEDRAELMAKTQLEREMILAKRAEERDNRKLRQELHTKDAQAPPPPPGGRPDAKRQAIANIRKAQERKKSVNSTKAPRRSRWVC